MSETESVYLGGELFDLKHLAGNAMLAEALEIVSERRYRVVLPQELEPPDLSPKAIRDADYRALLECDAAIFLFDGPDLDSGTVAEFMAAKFADLPALLLRTDFRRAGDRNDHPWNLMLSRFPRTDFLVVDGMELLTSARVEGLDRQGQIERVVGEVASMVIEKMDTLINTPPLGELDTAGRKAWVTQSLGI